MSVKNKSYIRRCFETLLEPAGVVAIALSLCAFFASLTADHFKFASQEKEKRTTERVISFIETTREFDALVPVLAHTIMDNATADTAKQKLQSNLSKQFSEIKDLEPLVKNQQMVDEYAKSLSELNSSLSTTPDFMGLAKYWESVSKVLEARRPLATELRKRASLDFR